ncbi:MAG: ribonuclease HII [Candidatus Sumerlaeia bacterium]|nr:ribonuclease HII [Candidatus Sumerlaeia bacterium]
MEGESEKTPKRALPGRRIELAFARKAGAALVAGVDEAGRGPLAGPVVAAAVVFDGRAPKGVDDSKRLTEARRLELFRAVTRTAAAWAVALATPEEIDALNILAATKLAACRAVAALSPAPGALVTDALELPSARLPCLALVKGDARCASIAAASILAKCARDAMMLRYHAAFPEYGWKRNKGYPVLAHYEAIARHGTTALHRRSFAGVAFFDEEPRAFEGPGPRAMLAECLAEIRGGG